MLLFDRNYFSSCSTSFTAELPKGYLFSSPEFTVQNLNQRYFPVALRELTISAARQAFAFLATQLAEAIFNHDHAKAAMSKIAEAVGCHAVPDSGMSLKETASFYLQATADQAKGSFAPHWINLPPIAAVPPQNGYQLLDLEPLPMPNVPKTFNQKPAPAPKPDQPAKLDLNKKRKFKL